MHPWVGLNHQLSVFFFFFFINDLLSQVKFKLFYRYIWAFVTCDMSDLLWPRRKNYNETNTFQNGIERGKKTLVEMTGWSSKNCASQGWPKIGLCCDTRESRLNLLCAQPKMRLKYDPPLLLCQTALRKNSSSSSTSSSSSPPLPPPSPPPVYATLFIINYLTHSESCNL